MILADGLYHIAHTTVHRKAEEQAQFFRCLKIKWHKLVRETVEQNMRRLPFGLSIHPDDPLTTVLRTYQRLLLNYGPGDAAGVIANQLAKLYMDICMLCNLFLYDLINSTDIYNPKLALVAYYCEAFPPLPSVFPVEILGEHLHSLIHKIAWKRVLPVVFLERDSLLRVLDCYGTLKKFQLTSNELLQFGSTCPSGTIPNILSYRCCLSTPHVKIPAFVNNRLVFFLFPRALQGAQLLEHARLMGPLREAFFQVYLGLFICLYFCTEQGNWVLA